MIDSIIFDLDGTLWDSTDIVAQAWAEALNEKTDINLAITPNLLKQQFGRPLPEIARNIFPGLSEKKQQEYIQLCCQKEHEALYKTPGRLYPELESTLKALSSRHPLFIVSNCQEGYIELFLEVTGFGKYFTDFECPGNTGLAKAENISLIIKRNSLKSPIYVGDTVGDENSCKKAGVPFIFASYGFGEVNNPDYIIKTPVDLLNIID